MSKRSACPSKCSAAAARDGATRFPRARPTSTAPRSPSGRACSATSSSLSSGARANRPCKTPAVKFEQRTIAPERAEQYVRDGFWDDRSLGAYLSEGLAEAAAADFCVVSDRRPYRGTIGDVDELARRVATGLRARESGRATPSRSSSRTGSKRPRPSTRSRISARSSCRSCTSTARRKSSYILAPHAREGARHRRPLRAPRLPRQPRRAARPTSPTSNGSPSSATTPGPATSAFADLVADEPIDAIPRRRSDRARARSRTRRARRRTRRVSCTRTARSAPRSASSVPSRPNRGGPADASSGAPVGHGIGMLAALLHPRATARTDPPHRRVGSGSRARSDARRERVVGGQGATYFLTSLLDHPDFDPSGTRR